MAAATITLYDHFTLRMLDATNILLPSGTFKWTLHTSAYTPSGAHAVYADLTNELATGFGYTNGGLAVASPALTTVTTNDSKFNFTSPVWTATGGSIPAWRYAVLRRSDTVNSLVGPLIAYVLGDSAPADIPATTDTNPLTFTVNAGGTITFTYT
jgi:hypothetical protein